METQRHPVTVRLLGVMHKEKDKMYMTSVIWSDQSEIVVYRSFQDFHDLHKKMKKAFPPSNPAKKSTRVVPKFQAKKMKKKVRKDGPSKSVVHLKFLEKYCNDLMSCDVRVAQSPEITKFLHPRDQDLHGDFAKNSIVIMPSDDAGHGGQGGGSVGDVTQPFVTETYRCLAPYETKDTKNKPFKVALDEKLDVLIKDKAGWWLVENEEKRMAWFPAPYLKPADDDEDDDEDEIHGTGALYTASKTYKATKVDEVSLEIGSVVEVLQKSENGWWLIRSNGKQGYVPTMYLQPYNNPSIRMANLQQDLRGSSLSLSRPQGPSTGLLGYSRELSRSQGNLVQDRQGSSLNLSNLSLSSTGLPGHSHQLSRSQGNLLQDRRGSNLNLSNLSASSAGLPGHSHQLSRSQGNLLQLPGMRSHSSNPLRSTDKSKSHSLNTAPAAAPTIMVEMHTDNDMRGRSSTVGSEDSFSSESSEFSSDDDSSDGSTVNLSHGQMDEQRRYSRTPQPVVKDRLSPTSSSGGRLMSSVSDPNLFQRPLSPKVPPRPRAQEILNRCTTATCKNVSKSPQSAEVFSR